MTIKQEYHFHAAHRNEEFPSGEDCRNIHGHTYHVTVYIHTKQKRNSSVSTPFSEIRGRIGPIIKSYDHALLLHVSDPFYCHLLQFPETLKTKIFPDVTSAENLARHLYREILETGLHVYRIDLRETTTSIITFTHGD